MKVSIALGKEDKVEPDFPCLMISNDQEVILLAIGIDGEDLEGIILEDKSGDFVCGTYLEYWNCSLFSEFAGTVTLSN